MAMTAPSTPTAMAANDDNGVSFRELTVLPLSNIGNSCEDPLRNDSHLWVTEHVKYSDLGRLHLRAVEAILSPTKTSADIISAVAYGVTSQGLRVTQRDDSQGRIMAQRIEAPYLASFSSGAGGRTRPGTEQAEWRVVVATLGVSRRLAPWGGVERVLRVEFMTDPCPKQDLAGRSAAAVASFAEWASKGIGSVGSSSSNGGKPSPSAVDIARQRSNKRADALIDGVVTELNRMGCAAFSPASSTMNVAPKGMMNTMGTGVREAGAEEGGEDKSDGQASNTKWAAFAPVNEDGDASEVQLVPWGEEYQNGRNNGSTIGVIAAVETPQQRSVEIRADGDNAPAVEVRICVQFAEGLCARAVEFSRRDALETWTPLEDTVQRLERDNAHLRQILEPTYRSLGASPPPVPQWVNKKGYGTASAAKSSMGVPLTGSPGVGGGGRAETLLRSSRLFVVEGAWVKAKVVSGSSSSSSRSVENTSKKLIKATEDAPVAVSRVTGEVGGGDDSTSEVQTANRFGRAVVKALADAIGGVCEAREEGFLNESMPGAQAYVAELEAYRSAIVGNRALRAVPASRNSGVGGGVGDDGDHDTVEIDDELWRLFGAMETRLYSSPAALGKKPGRIYLTCNTLWFHSKVMTFESRHVLPLAEVKFVSLLGTALDFSSSLVITTKDDAEIMLVFPGQRIASLEPVQLLIQQLAILAATVAED